MRFQQFDLLWTNDGMYSFYPAIVCPRGDYCSFLTLRGILR